MNKIISGLIKSKLANITILGLIFLGISSSIRAETSCDSTVDEQENLVHISILENAYYGDDRHMLVLGSPYDMIEVVEYAEDNTSVTYFAPIYDGYFSTWNYIQDLDTDCDGLSNKLELQDARLFTNPASADTDDDNLSDYYEAMISNTDPLEANLCFDHKATIVGTSGVDSIMGTDGPDVIMTFGGDDTIYGAMKKDRICAGDGNDLIYGEKGHDIIDGGKGNDYIYGNNGRDTILGGDGDDVIFGGRHDDTIDGEEGHDECDGEHFNTANYITCEQAAN